MDKFKIQGENRKAFAGLKLGRGYNDTILLYVVLPHSGKPIDDGVAIEINPKTGKVELCCGLNPRTGFKVENGYLKLEKEGE